MIRFKGKIWATGTAYVITIPMQYIKDEVVDPNKMVRVTVEENEEQPDTTD